MPGIRPHVTKFLILLGTAMVLFTFSCTDTISGEDVKPIYGPYDTAPEIPKTGLEGPPPFSELLGEYLGSCSRYRYIQDDQSGHFVSIWDSIDIEVTVLSVEYWPDHDNYIVHAMGGLQYHSYLTTLPDLQSDSVFLYSQWGGSMSSISLLPNTGKMYYKTKYQDAYGPQNGRKDCVCWKEW